MLTQARRLSWGQVEPGKLRSDRSVAGPASMPSPASQVPIPVQVIGKPDVVVHAAVAILDDVDVAVMVDRQVVRTAECGADRKACRQVDGIPIREDRDRLRLRGPVGKPRGSWSSSRRDIRAGHPLELHVLRALVVGALERRQVRGVARVNRDDAVEVGDGQRSGQGSPAASVNGTHV